MRMALLVIFLSALNFSLVHDICRCCLSVTTLIEPSLVLSLGLVEVLWSWGSSLVAAVCSTRGLVPMCRPWAQYSPHRALEVPIDLVDLRFVSSWSLWRSCPWEPIHIVASWWWRLSLLLARTYASVLCCSLSLMRHQELQTYTERLEASSSSRRSSLIGNATSLPCKAERLTSDIKDWSRSKASVS